MNNTQKKIFVNTALCSINPKWGYNKALYKSIYPLYSNQNVMQIYRDLHNRIFEIKNEIKYKDDFFTYEKYVFGLKIRECHKIYTNPNGNSLMPSKSLYLYDNRKYFLGIIENAKIDWKLSEKEFWSKYFGVIWKNRALNY
jgi:hypothetical protein